MTDAEINDIVIIGTGQFAEVVHYYLTDDGKFKVHAFAADGGLISSPQFCGLPVVPIEDLPQLFPADKFKLLTAIGYSKLNKVREAKYLQGKELGYEFATFIHRTSILNNASIGENCLIFENNVIQPFAKLGNNIVVWSCNGIGHHTVIDDHCFIAGQSLISAASHIGRRCFVGNRCLVTPTIQIGDDCILGANTHISKDAPANSVFGVAGTARSKVPSNRMTKLWTLAR